MSKLIYSIDISGDGGLLYNLIPGELQGDINQSDPKEVLVVLAVFIISLIVIVVLYILFAYLILRLSKRIIRRIEKKNGDSITIQFLGKAVSLVLILIFVVIPLGGKSLARSLLGSTAVMAAVVGLAANDVIKNMFAGLEISIYKPFEVGSRIMFEDGRAGIVEKLTLRHVVLRLMDTTRIIVPNSKANQEILVNYSYADEVPRSFEVRYNIAYMADIELAKEIIRRSICDCPLTLNSDEYNEKIPNSKMVYFLEVAESALVFGATVYYPFEYRTEVVKDEVNTMVFKALEAGGIEIPYNYVNVVVNGKSAKEGES